MGLALKSPRAAVETRTPSTAPAEQETEHLDRSHSTTAVGILPSKRNQRDRSPTTWSPTGEGHTAEPENDRTYTVRQHAAEWLSQDETRQNPAERRVLRLTRPKPAEPSLGRTAKRRHIRKSERIERNGIEHTTPRLEDCRDRQLTPTTCSVKHGAITVEKTLTHTGS